MSSASNPKATSAKDFRVAIVGGGMCGLACAVGLAKRGIHTDVFEAAVSNLFNKQHLRHG
jgi:2-polyprenyl-6-methoxyphenol hydroxylase-like FAD-dependent oxidoreductase